MRSFLTCAVGRTLLWRSDQGVRVLVGKPGGEKPFGIPKRKWEDNIKVGCGEIEWDGLDHNHVAQDRVRRLSVVDRPFP
jgi:hypothetical protein